LKIARLWNTIQKVPPGEAAHFFSAKLFSAKRMTPKSGYRFSAKVMRKR